jgi:hypothetical protein
MPARTTELSLWRIKFKLDRQRFRCGVPELTVGPCVLARFRPQSGIHFARK